LSQGSQIKVFRTFLPIYPMLQTHIRNLLKSLWLDNGDEFKARYRKELKVNGMGIFMCPLQMGNLDNHDKTYYFHYMSLNDLSSMNDHGTSKMAVDVSKTNPNTHINLCMSLVEDEDIGAKLYAVELPLTGYVERPTSVFVQNAKLGRADQAHGLCNECSWCRQCTHDSGKTIRKCGGCCFAQYCSRECQRAHWKSGSHKAFCEEFRNVDARDISNTLKLEYQQKTWKQRLVGVQAIIEDFRACESCFNRHILVRLAACLFGIAMAKNICKLKEISEYLEEKKDPAVVMNFIEDTLIPFFQKKIRGSEKRRRRRRLAKMNEDVPEEGKECPICFEDLENPRMCSNPSHPHTLCGACAKTVRGSKCPFCATLMSL